MDYRCTCLQTEKGHSEKSDNVFLLQEIAGLGGDAKYVRHETEFQVNKSFGLGSVSVLLHESILKN